MLPCSQAAQRRQADLDTLGGEYRIKLPEYSITSSGVFPSTSRAIFSMSSRPHFSLALMNWLKSLLFQLVKPCTAIKRKHCTEVQDLSISKFDSTGFFKLLVTLPSFHSFSAVQFSRRTVFIL